MRHIAIEFNAGTGSSKWHIGVILNDDVEDAIESGSVHVDFGNGRIYVIDISAGGYLLQTSHAAARVAHASKRKIIPEQEGSSENTKKAKTWRGKRGIEEI